MTKTFRIIVNETKTKTKIKTRDENEIEIFGIFSPDDIDENIYSKVWQTLLSIWQNNEGYLS